MKTFRSYDPILCYAHRLNNILKGTFFQKNEYSSIKLLPLAYSTSSSSEVDDDGDDGDDGIHFNGVSKPIHIKKKKLDVSISHIEQTVMTIKVIDIPPAAQQVIKPILECKAFAKYIKKVNIKQLTNKTCLVNCFSFT